jgi:hypothetical protein
MKPVLNARCESVNRDRGEIYEDTACRRSASAGINRIIWAVVLFRHANPAHQGFIRPTDRGPQAGRGMGLALAAELNGYPGPAHVLELSDKLGLTVEQRARVQQLFESMKQEAVPLGTRLMEQEAELDQQFAGRTVTPETLKAATASIAITQGRLRESHLKYHLATAALLTHLQIQQYRELRGYGSGETGQEHHGRPH